MGSRDIWSSWVDLFVGLLCFSPVKTHGKNDPFYHVHIFAQNLPVDSWIHGVINSTAGWAQRRCFFNIYVILPGRCKQKPSTSWFVIRIPRKTPVFCWKMRGGVLKKCQEAIPDFNIPLFGGDHLGGLEKIWHFQPTITQGTWTGLRFSWPPNHPSSGPEVQNGSIGSWTKMLAPRLKLTKLRLNTRRERGSSKHVQKNILRKKKNWGGWWLTVFNRTRSPWTMCSLMSAAPFFKLPNRLPDTHKIRTKSHHFLGKLGSNRTPKQQDSVKTKML